MYLWILSSGLIQYTWDGPLYVSRGVRLYFYKCIFGLKFLLTLINSVDADEMPHYAAFHQDLHCL